MSDNWICLIPRDPHFIPSDEAIERAEASMREIVSKSDGISFEVATFVRFRDCGANMESIRCPVCNALIPNDWWTEQMDKNYDGAGFNLIPISLPCEHSVPSLNELKYYFDVGFSKFILEVMNPNIAQLESSQIIQFENILGCPLKAIYQHI